MTDRLHPCGYKFCRYYFIPETEQCEKCLIKPKERVLDDWIKPFFDNCCRMEKIEK